MHRPTRGLAATAVAALALAGLGVPGAAPAAADPVDGIRLLSPVNPGRVISDRPLPLVEDGVFLTAEVEDPGAAVAFAWNENPDAGPRAGGWQTIDMAQESPTTALYRTVTWDLPDALHGGSVALMASVDAEGGPMSVLKDVQVAPAYDPESPDPDALDRAVPLPFGGAFVQPYADSGRTATLLPAFGFTSATEGTVEVSGWDPAAGEYAGQQAAEVQCLCDKGGSEDDLGLFFGTLDIADFGAEIGDEAAIAAERDTDSVVPVELTAAEISGISATGEETRPGQPGTVTLSVSSSDGPYLPGVEVRRSSDRRVVGYTDSFGTVTTTQLGGTTETYYANATDRNAFEPDVDAITEPFEQPVYEQEPTSIEPRLLDGRLFDVNESQPGDVSLQALDQEGSPIADQPLEYRLQPRPGDDVPWTQATTGPDGSVPVVLTGGESGTYELEYRYAAGDGGSEPGEGSVRFTTGQAEMQLDPDVARAPGGSTIDFTGRLVLQGRGLPGRTVGVLYLPMTGTGDASLVGGGQSGIDLELTTSGTGRVAFRLRDGREGPSEAGDIVLLTRDTVASGESTVAGNADARDFAQYLFGRPGGGDDRPVQLFRTGEDNGPRSDVLTVTGPDRVAGERVRILKVTRAGKRVEVAEEVLDETGDARDVRLGDRNGRRVTTYVAKLVPSARFESAETHTIRLR